MELHQKIPNNVHTNLNLQIKIENRFLLKTNILRKQFVKSILKLLINLLKYLFNFNKESFFIKKYIRNNYNDLKIKTKNNFYHYSIHY